MGNHLPEVAREVQKILHWNRLCVFGAHSAPDGKEAHNLFLGVGTDCAPACIRRRGPHVASGCGFLDHVLIYGLVLFVVCVCMCVCVWCACMCVLVPCIFLHLSLQCHGGRHTVRLFACFGVRACVLLFFAKLQTSLLTLYSPHPVVPRTWCRPFAAVFREHYCGESGSHYLLFLEEDCSTML